MSLVTDFASTLHKIDNVQITPNAKDSKSIATLIGLFRDREATVDVTSVYENLDAREKTFPIYTHYGCIIPPWTVSAFIYRDFFNNNIVHQISSIKRDEENVNDWEIAKERWPTIADEWSWDNVEWTCIDYLWLEKSGLDIDPLGPIYSFLFCLDKDGLPLNMSWKSYLPDVQEDIMEPHLHTMLQSLSLLNCKNVYIDVPDRPRKDRERLHKKKVSLSTIYVRPPRTIKKSKSEGVPLSSIQSPLHGVRGHFAEYGPKYGKGKLFGKYEGRFYIPPHLRGSESEGVLAQNYKIRT